MQKLVGYKCILQQCSHKIVLITSQSNGSTLAGGSFLAGREPVEAAAVKPGTGCSVELL